MGTNRRDAGVRARACGPGAVPRDAPSRVFVDVAHRPNSAESEISDSRQRNAFDARAPDAADSVAGGLPATFIATRAMSVSSAAASPIAPRARFARASSSSRGDAAVRRVSSDPSTSTARGSARTSGWGKRRGAIPPDSDLLLDPDTHGYCVYSHADWSYAYKSVVGEIDYPSCRVEGEIPDAIRGGVLYRAGPALFERGGVEYKHMLDGDGMVLRFAFGESQAQAPSSPPAPSSSACAFTSRFVRTTEFRAEEAAGAVVYRGTFGTMRAGGFAANALDLHQKNLANTNILAWGDRVYALYEAGRPVALDPVTLDAAGEDDLDGKLPPGMFVSAGAPRVGTRARTRRRRVHRPPTRRFAHGARRRVGLEEPRGESRGGGYVLGVGGGLVRADDADDVSPRRMRGGAARLRRDPIVVRPRAELSQGEPRTVPRRA